MMLSSSTTKLLLAGISTGDYNFHMWTSKPAENYFTNNKRTCKPPELHTIMKNAMVLDWFGLNNRLNSSGLALFVGSSNELEV